MECRALGYDNGSNMRGHTKGCSIKNTLEEKDTLPCKLNHNVVTFFGNIDSFYSLFSSPEQHNNCYC